MSEAGESPQEFDLPLAKLAVASAPAGFDDESPFDEPAPQATLEMPGGEGEDLATALRRTLGMFATGVTVITTSHGEQLHGMTANAFMSASLNPPLVLISVDRRARMCDMLHQGSRYGVSILAEEQSGLSDHFAGRAEEGAPEPVFEMVGETPLVEGALAHFVAVVDRSYYAGDHSLFLGRLEYARHREGTPLLYHGGRYERLHDTTAESSRLPADLVPVLLAAGEERSYADGEEVFSVGDPAGELFLVLDGSVRLAHPGRPDRLLEAGSFFGEVGAITGEPRSATATVEGDLSCVAVDSASLRETLASRPDVAWELLGSLAGRVRRAL